MESITLEEAIEIVRHDGWAILGMSEELKNNIFLNTVALAQTIRADDVWRRYALCGDRACVLGAGPYLRGYDHDSLVNNLIKCVTTDLDELSERMAYMATGAEEACPFHYLSLIWFQMRDAPMLDLMVTEEQGIYLSTYPTPTQIIDY